MSDGQLLHQQRYEVMALNTAMNNTSIFTPGFRSAGTCTLFELVHEHIPPSYSMAAKPLQMQAGAPRAATGLQQQGQILLWKRRRNNTVDNPGMEQPESIFPDFHSGDVFVYLTHPFAFAALLFHLIRAC